MKKFLSVIFTALSILIVLTNTSFAAEWGKGELKMSDKMVDVFIEYIKGKHLKSPFLFAIAKDGLQYQYYYCPAGLNNCEGGDSHIIKECNKYSEEYGGGAECALFSRNRTIKWKNGINKNTKINSKWSDEEIRAKLTELGFLGEVTSTEEKVSTTNKGNTVEQLETLTKLYESGNLTKEEFDAAKKKILND
jgi:hypothetical protein